MEGFYVWVSAGVSLYVWLYGIVDGTEWHVAGFLYDELSFTEIPGWFEIIWLLMSVQMKYFNNAHYFFILLTRVFMVHFRT